MTPQQVFNHSDSCVITVGNDIFVCLQSYCNKSNIYCTESSHLRLCCGFSMNRQFLKVKSSHGLTDVFQALLNVVNNLHCSLWDPGSWAEDGAHTALVQELIVLHTHRGGTQFIWTAVNEEFSFIHIEKEGRAQSSCDYAISYAIAYSTRSIPKRKVMKCVLQTNTTIERNRMTGNAIIEILQCGNDN